MDEIYMQGRGAWTLLGKDNGSRYYCFVSRDTRDGARSWLDLDHFAVHQGVRAIQIWMNTLGYGTSVFGKIPLDGRFGRRTRRGVKEFQHAEGLVEDGVFGPVVARKLFHPLITAVAETEEIPADILWGMTSQESLFDPGAVSSRYKLERGPDLGLCQINIRSNPQFTASQAFRPRQALTWSAQNYHEALRQFQWGGPELQVNCAIANHNSPVQARKWYDDGVPPSEQIAEYVADVLEAAKTY